jgi:hypothetical protein
MHTPPPSIQAGGYRDNGNDLEQDKHLRLSPYAKGSCWKNIPREFVIFIAPMIETLEKPR